MQNVQDDALLVQEICSFIHFIKKLKKRTHEKYNVACTLFFILLRKHFSGFGLARKGKKPVFLCDV